MSVRIAGLSIGLLTQIALSRTLGAENFGVYSVLLSWCLLFVVPVKFGMDTTILKFAAGYIESNDSVGLSGLVRRAATVLATTTSILTIGAVALSVLAPQALIFKTLWALLWMIVLTSSLGALGVFSQFFRAAKLIFFSQIFEQVLRPTLMLALLGLAILFNLDASYTTAMAITALSSFLALFGLLFTMRAKIPITYSLIKPAEPAVERKQWLSVSWLFLLTALAGQVLNQINIIMLGQFATPIEAGQFAVALRLASFVTFALEALNSISAPMIAAAYKSNSQDGLRSVATTNARVATAVGILICAILAAAGTNILGLFGPEFEIAYPALLLMLIGTIVGAMTGPVGLLLSMTGEQKSYFGTSVATLGVILIVSPIAVSQYGLMGAAMAACTTQLSLNLLRWWIVWHRVRVDGSFLGLHPRRVK